MKSSLKLQSLLASWMDGHQGDGSIQWNIDAHDWIASEYKCLCLGCYSYSRNNALWTPMEAVRIDQRRLFISTFQFKHFFFLFKKDLTSPCFFADVKLVGWIAALSFLLSWRDLSNTSMERRKVFFVKLSPSYLLLWKILFISSAAKISIQYQRSFQNRPLIVCFQWVWRI